MLTSIALAAAVAAQSSNGVQWVPLGSPQAKQMQGAAPTPAQVVQQVQPIQAVAAPAMPVAIQPTTNAYLRVGTEIPLRLRQMITTKGKQLRVGQRVQLETTEPVMVNGVNVIPVGSPGVAEITDVRNKGMWGKSGHFGARILYITVNGRQIRLSGAFDDKGVAGGVGAALVSGIVFLPAGFFMTGTSAMLPAGTIVKGFVDEDVPLALPAMAQAPLVVGTQAPMQVQPAGSAQPKQ